MTTPRCFGWVEVARLGLVQAALGAVVVLTTSTLNRVMVVELALPALLPGLLVAFHYLVQVVRPRMGHGADVTGRHTPWIVGGVAVLALGGIGAGLATALMQASRPAGIALAFVAFAAIGIGVAASGTSLLALLAKRSAPERRAASATIVWLMMIVGFVVTATVAGKLLDPYTPARLVAVVTGVSLVAFALATLAVHGLEPRRRRDGVRLRHDDEPGPGVPGRVAPARRDPAAPRFAEALARVWADAPARRFTLFVFVSMLAYSAQDLILEPFAGTAFGLTPGQTTQLSGVQHGGVLLGMLIAALAGARWHGRRFGSLTAWTVGGCLASAAAVGGLAVAGAASAAAGAAAGAGIADAAPLAGIGALLHGGSVTRWPIEANVFAMGVANGVFSIAAIGSMMRLAGEGQAGGAPSEGVRMGVWGAAQALAFGLGGVAGTGASDLAHALVERSGDAYALVFALEALLFVGAAAMAWQAVGDAMPTAARRRSSSWAPRRVEGGFHEPA